MTVFTATDDSAALVSARREDVWAALVDPDLLAQMTPLLERVVPDGDLWRWEMDRIPVLGLSVAPSFTEQMTFHDGHRIDFRHAPPAGTRERAGADGHYLLEDDPRGTCLSIHIELGVDLPLPRAAAPAVQRTMRGVLGQMGERYAANLLDHLDAVALT